MAVMSVSSLSYNPSISAANHCNNGFGDIEKNREIPLFICIFRSLFLKKEDNPQNLPPKRRFVCPGLSFIL